MSTDSNQQAESHETDADAKVSNEKIADLIGSHSSEMVVTERVQIPGALWSRLVFEKSDDESIEDYLTELTRAQFAQIDAEQSKRYEAEVELEPEQWERIRLRALYALQTRKDDPETAFADAVDELVTIEPQIVVDGEPVGPADLLESGRIDRSRDSYRRDGGGDR